MGCFRPAALTTRRAYVGLRPRRRTRLRGTGRRACCGRYPAIRSREFAGVKPRALVEAPSSGRRKPPPRRSAGAVCLALMKNTGRRYFRTSLSENADPGKACEVIIANAYFSPAIACSTQCVKPPAVA
ncbi:hypothetical protein KCP71_23320 [Salmonella enterica subsp. enterica]|nr:hypothetical protein KCP71_23320 [Salmonella enterica subsp. enterica]